MSRPVGRGIANKIRLKSQTLKFRLRLEVNLKGVVFKKSNIILNHNKIDVVAAVSQ